MRNEILQLKDLGRMPNESINDSDSKIFPENAFYDLQWSLLRLVESVCVDDDRYIQLINSCPSQEWRDTLNARYANYKKAQEVK